MCVPSMKGNSPLIVEGHGTEAMATSKGEKSTDKIVKDLLTCILATDPSKN